MGLSYHKQEEEKVNRIMAESGLIPPLGSETKLLGSPMGKMSAVPFYQPEKSRVDYDTISGAAPTAQKNIVEHYQLLYDTYNEIVNGEVQQRATQAAYDLADETGQMLSGVTAVGADIAADKFFGAHIPT